MNRTEDLLRVWSAREALAEEMIPVIGRLYRDHSVVTSIHGRSLVNQSSTEIIKSHRFARRIRGAELPLEETAPLVGALAQMELGAATIDVARLNERYRAQAPAEGLESFLRRELSEIAGMQGAPAPGARDVVLYGFGRIGRLVARILIAHGGGPHSLNVRAVVVRRGSQKDLVKRASLLRRDSVHGPFGGSITVDEEQGTILANGTLIQVIYSDDPGAVDYTAYGIEDALLVDSTGKWRDAEGLSRHLQSRGASRVLLTAPGKNGVKDIVHGVNHASISDSDRILTAASCTTNAITPVLQAVQERYGIVHGHVETVHSFTNDQNLIDNFHTADRRGRSAVLNMVITETGAARAVAKALPELAGKLTGSSIRVPTPDVSVAILNLTLEHPADRDGVNDYLREMSLHSPHRKQIDYVDSPEVVSTDFIGSQRTGIVDGRATICNGRQLVLYVWYDNEFGYSCQVVRVLETMSGVGIPSFPKDPPVETDGRSPSASA